jgi:hypothetical protein
MKSNPFFAVKWLHGLNIVLLVFFLFLPIVWMDIGPLGIEFYGPDVPDIYIYGGIITGKDLAFTPILIAMVLQAAFIISGIITSLFAFRYTPVKNLALSVTIFHSVSLALFPWWIESYKSGVACNSDGADLTMHWMSGAYVYLALVIVNICIYFPLVYAIRKSRLVSQAQ